MKEREAILDSLVRELPAITLEDMSSIRLMNRTDTKFVTNVPTLMKLLRMTQGSYYSQETNGKRISPYKKKLHASMLTIDSHCDTPMFFPQGVDFLKRDNRILVDYHRDKSGASYL